MAPGLIEWKVIMQCYPLVDLASTVRARKYTKKKNQILPKGIPATIRIIIY